MPKPETELHIIYFRYITFNNALCDTSSELYS